jgi:hypothetical protein
MATYKEIKGTQIEVLASDPSNPVEGQVWYNSTSNVLKGQAATTVGAWATGGSLNTGRRRMSGAGVSNSSALGFGGDSPGSTYYNNTESYDGTSWTEVNNLNTARGYGAGAGTQTSALMFGGSTPPISALTESWNGSNWTEVNDLNAARYVLAGAGASNTSALAFGGTPIPVSAQALTELWNGSNWTEVNDMNTARYGLAGWGTATSAIAATGETAPARVTLTNANRDGAGAAGADNTAGLIFGGFEQAPVDSRVNKTELWNGTSWSEEADLSGTAYGSQAGAGTASSAISFGGEGPSNEQRTGTEEWTGAGASVTRTFTDS